MCRAPNILVSTLHRALIQQLFIPVMFFSVRKLNIYTFRFEQGRGRKRNKNAFYLMGGYARVG